MATQGRRCWRWRGGIFGAVLAGAALAGATRVEAQGPVPNRPFGDGYLYNSNISGLPVARVAPQGYWVEVIMANTKWLVVQNQDGQQFPVAFDAVGQFLVRWPTAPALTSADALVEATGPDIGSNRVATGHVDVYEGPDRTMVGQTSADVPEWFTLVLSPVGVGRQNAFGSDLNTGFAGEYGQANSRHVVGPVVGWNPLRLSIGANNAVAIVPNSGDGISMTRVTAGTPTYAKKGDMAFVVPGSAGPRSLALGQLVLYKRMPMNQFAP